MRAREYFIMQKAIESGVQYGWTRAHKHEDDPKEYVIINAIEEAVMSTICEYFLFEEVEE